jgi:hypothetical protein
LRLHTLHHPSLPRTERLEPGALRGVSLGRNTFRGPSFFGTDVAIVKDLRLMEATSAQFRTEIRNAFNRVNLGSPNNCVDCNGFGEITQLAPGAVQRQIEFALRFNF